MKDIDTLLRCSIENETHPIDFLQDILKDFCEFNETDISDLPDEGWLRFALRLQSIMIEEEKCPSGAFMESLNELLYMMELFFASPLYDHNSFDLEDCCSSCPERDDCCPRS